MAALVVAFMVHLLHIVVLCSVASAVVAALAPAWAMTPVRAELTVAGWTLPALLRSVACDTVVLMGLTGILFGFLLRAAFGAFLRWAGLALILRLIRP